MLSTESSHTLLSLAIVPAMKSIHPCPSIDSRVFDPDILVLQGIVRGSTVLLEYHVFGVSLALGKQKNSGELFYKCCP